ncbi:MAG: transglutaminaseTgpA domain-containing protein [bacterium]
MRFIVVHKVCTYLMVGTALAAVLLGGDVGPLGTALIVLGALASWWWEPPRVSLARYEKLWNIATLLMLARAGVAVVVDASVLQAASDFVLFLTLNRLFNRRTSRDYQQLYVLSFLQMTAATVLNAELSYGVLFLIYVVATTWTLILVHLKREMEENYLLKYGESLEGRPVRVQRVMNSRKLVGPASWS